MRNFLWLLGIGVCFCACKKERQVNRNIEIGEVVESINMADIADTVNYVRLETTPEALIGTIYDIQVADSLIFILETLPVPRIFCFMTDGRFRYKIDAMGKGPDEYVDLESFTIDKNKGLLELNERTRKKIHLYDFITGQRVGEKKSGYYYTSFVALADGHYLLLGEQDMKYRYQVVDSLFELRGGVDKYNENLDIEYPFVFTCQDNRVYFGSLKSSVIYTVDKNDRKIREVARVNFGQDAVPEEWFESPDNKKDFIIEEVMRKKLSIGIHGIMSWREGIVFSYNQGGRR